MNSTAPVHASVLPFGPSAVFRLWISKIGGRPPVGALDHFLRPVFRLLSTGIQKEQAAPIQITVNVPQTIAPTRLQSNYSGNTNHPAAIITKVIRLRK